MGNEDSSIGNTESSTGGYGRWVHPSRSTPDHMPTIAPAPICLPTAAERSLGPPRLGPAVAPRRCAETPPVCPSRRRRSVSCPARSNLEPRSGRLGSSSRSTICPQPAPAPAPALAPAPAPAPAPVVLWPRSHGSHWHHPARPSKIHHFQYTIHHF